MGRGFIDNAAHLGGLASGAALGLVVDYKRPGERASMTFTWSTLQALALAVVAVSFFMVARHFNSHPATVTMNPSVETQIKDQQAVGAYLNALNEGQRAFRGAAIGKPETGAFDRALEDLNQATGPDETSDHLRVELKTILERSRNLVAAKEKDPRQQDDLMQTKQLNLDFQGWIQRRDQWIKDEGERYGLELTPPDDSNSNDNSTPESARTPAPGAPRKP
jgi:hypothetical protein